MTTFEKFTELHASLPTVDFNPAWNNGTSYYDHLCDDKELNIPKGTMVACTSVAPNSRRMIILGLGNGLQSVVFERFTPNMGSPEVLVCNQPSRRDLKGTNIELPELGGSSLTLEHFNNFVQKRIV